MFLLLCAITPTVFAQTSNPFEGRWDSKSISVQEVSATCRYFEVVTSTYDLAPGMNGTVGGIYTRMLLRNLLTPFQANCLIPGQHAAPGFLLRSDRWLVQGEPQSQRQRIIGRNIGCTGDCQDATGYPTTFEGTLSKVGMRLHEQSTAGQQVFQPANLREQQEANASAALSGLMRPLLSGDCNLFFVRSLDPSSQAAIKQEHYCVVGRGFGQLLHGITSDRHVSAHAASVGLIRGATRPLLVAEGDVFVQRFFLFDAQSGIPINAVLRKQRDGEWKILDLVP